MIFDFLDANCSLLQPSVRGQLDQVLERSRKEGINGAILSAHDSDEWSKLANLKPQAWKVYKCYGLHPLRLQELEEEEIENQLNELAPYLGKASALGVIGLDYRPALLKAPKEHQWTALEEQLELAEASGLSLLLHLKQCHSDAMKILDFWSAPNRKGIVLDFSEGPKELEDLLDRGLSISIGYRALKGSKKLVSSIKDLPLERLILESSSPNYYPFPATDRLGDPLDLWKVANEVGRIKQYRPSELLEISRANIERVVTKATRFD